MANSRKTKVVPASMICHKKRPKSKKRVARGKALAKMMIARYGSKAKWAAAMKQARKNAKSARARRAKKK